MMSLCVLIYRQRIKFAHSITLSENNFHFVDSWRFADYRKRGGFGLFDDLCCITILST